MSVRSLYLLGKPEPHDYRCVFESFSGLTTTGATTLVGLDSLPHAILFYRQMLQWFGGMGIIVLAVAILPILGVGGMQLYRAEMPGPLKDNKMRPRIAETAKTLWLIYVLLTVACALALWFAGMDAFDAIGHSFATIAIGGFSTHDASIGYFDSPTINTIIAIFLLISGCNYGLHFSLLSGRSLKVYWRDPEFRMFIGVQFTLVVICTLVLWFHNVYSSALMTINQRFSVWCRWRQPPGLRLTALPAGRSFAGTAFMFSFYRRLCRVNGRWPESDPHPAAV